MLKLKKDAYNYNLGVDDIEDVISAGLDWSDPDIEYGYDEEPRDYDDASKLITIDKAEKIIGERPDASVPKPPTSKNPRPDTIRKYQDAVKNFKERKKELAEWESKFDRLVALCQLLKNTKDRVQDVMDDLAEWCTRYRGIYLVRQGLNSYSWTQDPVSVLEEYVYLMGIPDEIKSLDDRARWNFENADFDDDTDIFPTVLITLGKKSVRFIVIPDNINTISDVIEDYVDTIQPHNLLSETKAKLDQKSLLILQKWRDNKTTNSQLTKGEKEMKLYLASVAFLKEVQQYNKFPSTSEPGKMVKEFLRQI